MRDAPESSAPEGLAVPIPGPPPASGEFRIDAARGLVWGPAWVRRAMGHDDDGPIALRRVLRWIDATDRRIAMRAWRRAMRPGDAEGAGVAERAFELAFRVRRRTPGARAVSVRGRARFEGRGARLPRTIVGSIGEVTEPMEPGLSPLSAIDRFRLATEAIEGMIYDWDVRTGHVVRSEGLVELLGVRPGDDRPDAAWWAHRVHPEDLAKCRSSFESAVASGAAMHEAHYRIRHEDGRWIWIHDRMRLVRDASGALVRAVGVSADVTAEMESRRKIRRLERQRRRATARLRAFVEAAPLGITILDRQLRYRLINSRLADMNGPPPEAHLGKTVAEVLPELAPAVEPTFRRILDTGEVVEDFILEGQTPKQPGVTRVWRENWFPIPGARGRPTGVGVVVQEITEQRRAEEALRASEARFRTLAETMPQIVWMADAAGSVTFVSGQFAAVTGLPVSAALGEGWRTVIHPDDLGPVGEAWARAFAQGTELEVTLRYRMADGGYRWFLSRVRPLKDELGRVREWFGTSTEIEALKQAEAVLARDKQALERLVAERTAELERAHQEQRYNERMAYMGTLAAGLGHDLNNVLVPVRIRLGMLEHAGLDAEAAEDVRSIQASLEYAKRLADGLRMLAVDPLQVRAAGATAIAEWWVQVEPLLKMVLPSGVALEHELSDERVAASPAVLTQIVFNLVQNAGDALRDRPGGRVRVAARRAGNAVELLVIDNGPGMADDVRRRCLEPFFTTKPRGRSTGLGLAVVHACVRHAGGTLDVESVPDRGATFIVSLPRAADPPSSAARAQVNVGDPRRRSLVVEVLRGLRCQVLEPTSAQAPSLLVVDRVDQASGAACPVVALLDPPPLAPDARIHCLGPTPSAQAIREALRRAASEAP